MWRCGWRRVPLTLLSCSHGQRGDLPTELLLGRPISAGKCNCNARG